MSTVLRVKRKIEDNPQDALVLLCKRMKTDSEEVSPSLFVFRGTVDNQETTSVKEIVPRTEFKIKSSHNVNDIIQKIRKERKEASTEHRYEVVNCSRALKDLTNEDDGDLFDLVDLQKSKTDGEEKNVQYAYDLYTSAKQDFDVSMIDNLVGIENYETSLIFGSHRDNGVQGSDDDAGDDDDSNDENNWRNEYPDTENSSIDEEDMVKAMEKCDIEDNLSSDTGEDKIYDDPPDIMNVDAEKYGAAYAKYKARVLAEETDQKPKNLILTSKSKDMDEGSVEGYKEDSDDDGFYYGQDEDTEHFKEQYGDHQSSDENNPD